MLGKGLESLIPPHRSPKPPDLSSPQGETPVGGSAAGAVSKPHGEEIKNEGETKIHRPSLKNTAEGDAIFHIEVERIKPNPHQPRREFDEASLLDLGNSIREYGILQPLVVTKVEKETPRGTEVEYELIAGERRLKAAKMIGLPRVPVVVRKINVEREQLEMSVIENLQREDLNPIERARAFARLQDEFHLTQREIATRLGKSREVIANTLRLLDLPTYIQETLAKGEISESHGRLLLAVTDQAAQEKLFRDLVDKHLTTRDLKNRMAAVRGEEEKPHLPPPLSPELSMLQEKLSSELGAPVKIERHGETGKITITFYSGEELKNIVARLGGKEE